MSTSSLEFITCRLLMMAILTGVMWHLIVILVYISLVIINVEHLSVYLLGICISLKKCLFRFSALFWLVFFLNVELYELFVYFGNYLLVSCIIFKYFLPVHRLCFHFVYGFFSIQKLLYLIRSHLFIFVFRYLRRWI